MNLILFQRRLPQEQPHVCGIVNLSDAGLQQIALKHDEKRRSEQQCETHDKYRAQRPKSIWSNPANHPQTGDRKHRQAENRAKVTTPTSCESNTRKADGGAVPQKNPHTDRKPPPAGDIKHHQSHHLKQARQMIRTDVKAAGPPLIIGTKDSGEQHEIIRLLELDGSDDHMGRRADQQCRHKADPPSWVGKINDRDAVNQQRAGRHVEIGAREIFHWGSHAPANDVSSKQQRARKAQPSAPAYPSGDWREYQQHGRQTDEEISGKPENHPRAAD